MHRRIHAQLPHSHKRAYNICVTHTPQRLEKASGPRGSIPTKPIIRVITLLMEQEAGTTQLPKVWLSDPEHTHTPSDPLRASFMCLHTHKSQKGGKGETSIPGKQPQQCKFCCWSPFSSETRAVVLNWKVYLSLSITRKPSQTLQKLYSKQNKGRWL